MAQSLEQIGIPSAFSPAINLIARQVYAAQGCEVPEGYDFSNASHPTEIACYQCAIAILLDLQTFSRKEFDTDLNTLIGE